MSASWVAKECLPGETATLALSAMRPARRLPLLSLALLLIPALYAATMARAVVWGDPTEYTFVSHILGIAHPPGYAFFTLVGKLFQTLAPAGPISWRMHLVNVVGGTLAALFVYGAVVTIGRSALSRSGATEKPLPNIDRPLIAGVFAALTVALAADFWQHAIHANPHLLTAAFLAANLFLLTRWAAVGGAAGPGRADRLLYVFSLSAGLGVTHHPLTVFSFPAYALFILLVRPRIWREWRTLLLMVAFALLGLSVWLYFPIRSAANPPFGPSTMNTIQGFLDHVLARGLSESLPFFSLADQPGRLTVFWTLLRLQYALPVIALALLGWAALLSGRPAAARNPNPRHFAVLYGLAFLGNYAFVISLRAQDIMAYLLGPFIVVGLLAGVGANAALDRLAERRPNPALLYAATAALFLIGPVRQLWQNLPAISLRNYDAAAVYIDDVFERFEGRGEGAVLLNDWEHMTPLWYARFVEGRLSAEEDVRPELVSTARPWLESVFAYLPGGPVYLSNYRREIVDAGFRLRPDGPFYQVVEPGETSVPAHLTQAGSGGESVEIVGYELPQRDVRAGDYVPLTLAMRAAEATGDYYVPVVRVGELSFPFTTDSHLITPLWQPGEAIVERFDFALPHDLPAGNYPVQVGLKNLSADGETGDTLALGELVVAAQERPPQTGDLLANFRQRVGLAAATARGGGQRAQAPWTEPLVVRPGETVNLALEWRSLAPAEESYTVFVHLIDPANRPLAALDYTPLGGSAPTHLWIPKWLPGQTMRDPYRLVIPPDIAPGTYYAEVGLYEMTGGRRLHMADPQGNLIGDRFILGPIRVEAE